MKNYTEFIYESVAKSNLDKDFEKLSDIFYTFWTTLDDKLGEIESNNSKNPQEVFKYNETIKKKLNKPVKKSPVTLTNTTTPTTTVAPAAPVAPTKPVKQKQKTTVKPNPVKQKPITVAKNVTNPTISTVPKK